MIFDAAPNLVALKEIKIFAGTPKQIQENC